MYVVGEGRVRVHDGDVLLTELERGAVFGEISALVTEPRTASVTADSECVLYRIDQKTLYKNMELHLDAFRAVIAGLCQRGRDMAVDSRQRAIKVQVYEHELEIGRQIQAGFLPGTLPTPSGWEIASHFAAAREVAGDFYDVFAVDGSDGHLAVFIGDVCGKGVGAALFMTIFRSLLRASTLLPGLQGADASADRHAIGMESTLRNAVVLTNTYIATTHADSSMFASVFFGLLDTNSGELLYINGGHECPVIVNGQGDTRRLDLSGPALGLFPEASYEVRRERLSHGDMLVAYTDGVPEAMNPAREQFTEDRLLQIAGRPGGSPPSTLAQVLDEIGSFTAGAEQHDDITLLAVKRL